MPIEKKIVLLASSWMKGGRCLAGKVVLPSGMTAEWIRVVDAHGNGLPWRVRRYANDDDPKVLDIIEVPLLTPVPVGHQTENWLADDSRRWVKKREQSRDCLPHMVDHQSGRLWNNRYIATSGPNARIRANRARHIKDSLRLVRVEDLKLDWTHSGDEPDVHGEFTYLDVRYRFSCTDHEIKTAVKGIPDDSKFVGGSYLTISLAKEWNGWLYKILAAVIPDTPIDWRTP